jgi:hypothetical protein
LRLVPRSLPTNRPPEPRRESCLGCLGTPAGCSAKWLVPPSHRFRASARERRRRYCQHGHTPLETESKSRSCCMSIVKKRAAAIRQSILNTGKYVTARPSGQVSARAGRAPAVRAAVPACQPDDDLPRPHAGTIRPSAGRLDTHLAIRLIHVGWKYRSRSRLRMRATACGARLTIAKKLMRSTQAAASFSSSSD